MTDDDDDAVGYGRPPKQHRFKPGHSGNPRGKPKGAKSRAALLEAALRRRVPVTENGKKARKSLLEIGAMALANKFAKGDLAAWKVIAEVMRQEEAARPDMFGLAMNEHGRVVIKLDLGDNERIKQNVARIAAGGRPDSSEEPPEEE